MHIHTYSCTYTRKNIYTNELKRPIYRHTHACTFMNKFTHTHIHTHPYIGTYTFVVLRHNEWKNVILLYINISHNFISRKGWNIVSVRERQGDEGQTGDCYIDPYLLSHVVLPHLLPHLALLLLHGWGGVIALLWVLASSSPWLIVTARLCVTVTALDWMSAVGTCVYMIS